MDKRPADYLLPDVPGPQPGPKWLSMSSRDRRKWEDKQWTDPDGDYDGPPLTHPPSYKPNWYQSILGVLGLLGLILGPLLLAAWHRHVSDRELEFGVIATSWALVSSCSGNRSIRPRAKGASTAAIKTTARTGRKRTLGGGVSALPIRNPKPTIKSRTPRRRPPSGELRPNGRQPGV